MKKALTFIFTVFLINSCDAPRNSRFTRQGNLQNTDSNEANLSDSNTNLNSGDNQLIGDQSELPPDFVGCKNERKSRGSMDIQVCQSKIEKSEIRVHFLRSSGAGQGDRTCFFPTAKDRSDQQGGSFNLAYSPNCLPHDAQDKENIFLGIDRPGFSTDDIDGIIVMKQRDIDPYILCMDLLGQGVPQYRGENTSDPCWNLPPSGNYDLVPPMCMCYYFAKYKTSLEFSF
jgi:hypothetical protein